MSFAPIFYFMDEKQICIFEGRSITSTKASRSWSCCQDQPGEGGAAGELPPEREKQPKKSGRSSQATRTKFPLWNNPFSEAATQSYFQKQTKTWANPKKNTTIK